MNKNTSAMAWVFERKFTRYIFQVLALLLMSVSSSFAAQTQDGLIVFVRDGCPHCEEAREFLPVFAAKRPELKIVLRPVDRDPAARNDLAIISRSAGVWPPGVPTFVFGDRVLVGFENAERTGPELAALVDRKLEPPESIETSLFGTLSASRLGLPLFTLAMGLLDGFNPCAMWVLLFLLSLLVHLHDRKRMALVAGTFVLVSGAVYYAFMAAWLNVLLFVGMSSVLRWILGGLAVAIGAVNIKDFFRAGREFSLSIPDTAKAGLYVRMRSILQAESLPLSLVGVAALAVIVNFIELLCTSGLPTIYVAVLTQHNLGPSAHYAYLGLYILGYIADDTLMVASAVIALSSHKLSERGGHWLKLLSGVVMLVLGEIMILRPEWLL
jgi:glutaredoxin